MVNTPETHSVEIDVYTTRFRIEQCHEELTQLINNRRILYGPGWYHATASTEQPADDAHDAPDANNASKADAADIA